MTVSPRRATLVNVMDSLYQVPKKELRRAARVMMEAFREDPLWNKFFAGVSGLERKLPAFYEIPLRVGYTYGDVLATSAGLEGVAAWIPGHLADMSFWRLVRSGALGAGFRLGLDVPRRLGRVFGTMENDRRAHMQGLAHYYLMIIGVAPEHQGKRLGSKLIHGLMHRCNARGESLYLETETERNAEMYQRLGFKLLKRFELSELELPIWEMVYEPDAVGGP